MTRALAAALADVVDSRDSGAVALARRYAVLIDAAAPTAAYGRHLRALRAGVALLDAATREQVEPHLQRIEAALAAHSVASDLGPKLLAALSALRLTPAARIAAAQTRQGAASDGPAPLDQLRARRARRNRAQDLDSPPAGADT